MNIKDLKARSKRNRSSSRQEKNGKVRNVQLTHQEEITVYHRMYDVYKASYLKWSGNMEFTKPEDKQETCEHGSARLVNRARNVFAECPTCNAHSPVLRREPMTRKEVFDKWQKRNRVSNKKMELIKAAYTILPYDPDGAWSSLDDYGVSVQFDDLNNLWKQLEACNG